MNDVRCKTSITFNKKMECLKKLIIELETNSKNKNIKTYIETYMILRSVTNLEVT
jgi:hypothetical protein